MDGTRELRLPPARAQRVRSTHNVRLLNPFGLKIDHGMAIMFSTKSYRAGRNFSIEAIENDFRHELI